MKKQKLQKIAKNDKNKLRQYVAQWILDESENYDGDIKAVINDLMQGGCVSGMVSELIYYVDTHAFFDKFYTEIEELRQDYKNNTGIDFIPKNDLKNDLAWLAFEETALNIANEIGIEI